MATAAMIGYQTAYAINDGAVPGVFVELAEVISVTPGEATADRVEATHMNSPNRRREYISGLIDAGSATVEINWVPGSDTDVFLRELFESGEVRDHRITFPNGAVVTFEASITGYSKSIPIDDRMTATLEVSVSGAETWTAAA